MKINVNQILFHYIYNHISHSFSIFSLQFSVDGSEIICGSNDTCVYIYDLQKQKRILRVNILKIKNLIKIFDIK